MKRQFLPALLLSFAITSAAVASGGQWPMWRADAARTGSTGNPLPDELALLWHRGMGYPDAAFIHQFRMCADAAYTPVAADGLLFVPSNLRDEVAALDLATGKTVWRYITGGPVRYAPVYADGRLYFGSDDGMLYCLKAATGELQWKVRGIPRDLPTSKLLINGRLCSRWPLRGAPVVYQGRVFFGTGVWPEEGVYVSAVDAQSGKLLWQTDALSVQVDGMNDHGNVYDLGLPPQGYLAIINGKLAVPSGRTLAIFLDPETGETEPYNSYYTKHNQPRGTWWLTGNDRYWIQAGSLLSATPIDVDTLPPETMDLDTFADYADMSAPKTLAILKRFLPKKPKPGVKPPRVFGGLNRVQILEKDGKTTIKAALRSNAANGTFVERQPTTAETFNYENRPLLNADAFKLHDEVLYTEPVLSGDTLYNSILDDPKQYLVERGETFVQYPEFDRIVARDMSRAEWKIHLTTYHIVRKLEFPIIWELELPHRVLIAAKDKVVAGTPGEVIVITQADGKPEVAFRAKVDGAPVNALVSDGQLVVSTSAGKLYCFGSGPATAEADIPVKRDSTYGKPHYPPYPEGYALVLGWGTGKLPEKLLAAGKHQVIVLEPDAALAAKKRKALAKSGVYGRQIQIITDDPSRLLLSKYWANLVTSEDLTPFATALPQLALDTVRPYSGKLIIPTQDRATPLVKAAATSREFTIDTGGAWTPINRTTAPTGSDDWTHETAGPGNTFANRDELVRGPLGLLWFSGYIDRFYTPEFHFQHDRAPYPLVSQGRMFLITGKYMNAVDVYTGNFLWQIEMPMTQRVEWRYMDSRVYSRPYDRNYIATPDTLYIIYEQEIHLISTATGEKQGAFTIPKELPSATSDSIWTEVRLTGDRLCCAIGDTLVCLDRKTGELLWHRKSTLDGSTYALSDNALIGVDYIRPPGIYKAETAPRKRSTLFQLALASGKQQWTTSFEHATVPEQNPKAKKLWLQPIIPRVIYNAKHRKAIVVVNRMTYYAFDAASGKKSWEHAGSYPEHSLHLAPMPLVADDILFGSTADYKSTALVLDVATGEVVDDGTWLNYKRGCSRVIGNGNMLTYRNAAAEVFDYENKTRLNFNSVRSGCTANFLPADGVMNAPSFGHGCVCNYPTFASLALANMPEAATFKPDRIKAREVERTTATLEQNANTVPKKAIPSSAPVADVSGFELTSATLTPAPGGCVLSTIGKSAGFAIKKMQRPMTTGTLSCSFQGIKKGKTGRHSNSFLVLGSSSDPEELIQIQIYHGGAQRISISGDLVDEKSETFTPARGNLAKAIVRIDLAAERVSVEVAGTTLETAITGTIPAITHIGYGGSNSDTFFTEIETSSEE